MCCLFLLRFLRWFVFGMCGTHSSPNPNSSKLISNSPCYLTSQSMGLSCFVFSCCLIFVVALWLAFLFKMRLWYASPFYFLSCICFVWSCGVLLCVLLMFWGLFCYTSNLFFCSWLVSHFWAAEYMFRRFGAGQPEVLQERVRLYLLGMPDAHGVPFPSHADIEIKLGELEQEREGRIWTL